MKKISCTDDARDNDDEHVYVQPTMALIDDGNDVVVCCCSGH